MQAFSMLLQYSLCLIVMTVTTSAFAAEPEVITVAPNFQVGDKIAFVTKKVRAQVINGATLPSPEVYWDNTIEVIEQDEHGFVLSWMRGKIRVDPPEPLPPAVTALADLWSDVRIDLLVTPEGRILDVSNYDDLKTYLEKTLVMTRDLLKEAGQDEALIDKTISTMRNLINDRSIGSTMLLKDIAGLFGAYQREIDIKGKTEYDIELPNPMGGSPIPATEVWQEPQPMAEDGTVISPLRTSHGQRRSGKIGFRDSGQTWRDRQSPQTGSVPSHQRVEPRDQRFLQI